MSYPSIGAWFDVVCLMISEIRSGGTKGLRRRMLERVEGDRVALEAKLVGAPRIEYDTATKCVKEIA